MQISQDNEAGPSPEEFPRREPTRIDLSTNPDDFSPAVNSIVAKVQEALSAGQRVLLMLGEEHTTTGDLRLAEMVRRGLHRAGIENPVMAMERNHNFLEQSVPKLFPESNQASLRVEVSKALAALKHDDPAQYNRLRAMALGMEDTSMSPVTRLENLCAWLESGLDIRLVDLSITPDSQIINFYFNYDDPTTRAFVFEHAPQAAGRPEPLSAITPEGLRLRNIFMAAQLNSILDKAENRVVILQTGLAHLGGDRATKTPYRGSLHQIFSHAARKDIKVLSLFSEIYGYQYSRDVPTLAQDRMDNPDTIILRGGNPGQHEQNVLGSFEGEIDALKAISQATDMHDFGLRIQNEADYNAVREKFRAFLIRKIEELSKQYQLKAPDAVANSAMLSRLAAPGASPDPLS